VPSGQRVVLKVFHQTADPERALRELSAVDGLDGHRVPKVLDSGMATSGVGDHTWFVEQFVEGSTLGAVLAVGIPDPRSVTRWADQTLATLVVAESIGVVHRDIKPANVIIDPAGDAWLIDFGIARHLGLLSVTSTSALMGPHSAGYAPPEQFGNSKHEVDTRADLFALGVTLYECLEGLNPYLVGASSRDEVLNRVASTDLPQVGLRDGVSPQLADLVQAMTRRALSQRPRSAADALEWLREA
jgi:serine/threonine protein kinase